MGSTQERTPAKKAAARTNRIAKKAAKAGARAPYRKPEEVRELILAAAHDLFSERLPGDVAIRDIAARAGVQHSLVHRHFATKERLLTEVIDKVTQRYADAVRGAPTPTEGFVRGLDHLIAHPAGPIALAGVMVGRTQPDRRRASYPGYDEHHRQLLAAGAPDDESTRELAVTIMALISGWSFMEEWWMHSGDLSEVGTTKVRASVAATIDRLVQQHLGEQG